MRVYKDGNVIVLDQVPAYVGKTFNINTQWSFMDQNDAGNSVFVGNALTETGGWDTLANTTDLGGTPYTLSSLRAVINS